MYRKINSNNQYYSRIVFSNKIGLKIKEGLFTSLLEIQLNLIIVHLMKMKVKTKEEELFY